MEQVTQALVSKTPYREVADLQGLETMLGNWADFIITDGAETSPTFGGDHRLTATTILMPWQGPTSEWQQRNRQKTLDALLAKLEERFGIPFEQIDPVQLSDEEQAAYEVEVKIIAALMGQNGVTPTHPVQE